MRYKVTVTRTEVHFVDAPNALAARAIVSNADSEPPPSLASKKLLRGYVPAADDQSDASPAGETRKKTCEM